MARKVQKDLLRNRGNRRYELMPLEMGLLEPETVKSLVEMARR